MLSHNSKYSKICLNVKKFSEKSSCLSVVPVGCGLCFSQLLVNNLQFLMGVIFNVLLKLILIRFIAFPLPKNEQSEFRVHVLFMTKPASSSLQFSFSYSNYLSMSLYIPFVSEFVAAFFCI